MGRWVNADTGVLVSVDDSKDDRFAGGSWDQEGATEKATAKPAAKRTTRSPKFDDK